MASRSPNLLDQLSAVYEGVAGSVAQLNTLAREAYNLSRNLAANATAIFHSYRSLFEGREILLQQTHSFEDPFKAIRDSLGQIPFGVVNEIQNAFTEYSVAYQSQWQETERDAFAIFEKIGLVGLENYLTRSELLYITQVYKKKGRKGAQAYVLNKFRRKHFKLLNQIVRKWWQTPYMGKRKKAVRLAIKAHQLGQFGLAIPALLPLIDGISAELAEKTFSGGHTGTIHMTRVASQFNQQEGAFSSACLEHVVRAMVYRNYDFKTAKRPPSSVNRHAILHGRVANYGTEINSYRVILLLDIVVRMRIDLEKKTPKPLLVA